MCFNARHLSLVFSIEELYDLWQYLMFQLHNNNNNMKFVVIVNFVPLYYCFFNCLSVFL